MADDPKPEASKGEPETTSQLDRIEELLHRILEAVTGRSGSSGGLGH